MRGVSPIVSTILMVAIAIAAAVVVYYVVMNVVSTQGAQLEQQASQGQEKIVIESVGTLSKTGKTIDVYVRNLSDTNVQISAAYVLGADGTVKCSDIDMTSDSGTTVPANSVGKVTLNFGDTGDSCNVDTGTYTLKIVTEKGTVVTKPIEVTS